MLSYDFLNLLIELTKDFLLHFAPIYCIFDETHTRTIRCKNISANLQAHKELSLKKSWHKVNVTCNFIMQHLQDEHAQYDDWPILSWKRRCSFHWSFLYECNIRNLSFQIQNQEWESEYIQGPVKKGKMRSKPSLENI